MATGRVVGDKLTSGPACSVTEYGKIGDADVAEATINGRYPEQGFSLNRKSDMMIRVISGTGAVALREVGFELYPGNVILIEKETPYSYEGDQLCVVLVCSPAWNKDQYEIVD